MPEDSIKKVDEDWKRRAQEEKKLHLRGPVSEPPPPASAEPRRSEPSEPGPHPPSRAGRTPFMDFLNGLATEVLIYLGAVAHPQTGQAVYAPDQAKQTIDLLHLLEAKTKGNLTLEEAQLLRTILHELRLAFVEATAPPLPPPPPGAKRR